MWVGEESNPFWSPQLAITSPPAGSASPVGIRWAVVTEGTARE